MPTTPSKPSTKAPKTGPTGGGRSDHQAKRVETTMAVSAEVAATPDEVDVDLGLGDQAPSVLSKAEQARLTDLSGREAHLGEAEKVDLGYLEAMVREGRRDVIPMAFGTGRGFEAARPHCEVIESIYWAGPNGRRASVYGAVPWTSEQEKPLWERKNAGYTIQWEDGTVGCGRPASETEAEAKAILVNVHKSRQAYLDGPKKAILNLASDAFRVEPQLEAILVGKDNQTTDARGVVEPLPKILLRFRGGFMEEQSKVGVPLAALGMPEGFPQREIQQAAFGLMPILSSGDCFAVRRMD